MKTTTYPQQQKHNKYINTNPNTSIVNGMINDVGLVEEEEEEKEDSRRRISLKMKVLLQYNFIVSRIKFHERYIPHIW